MQNKFWIPVPQTLNFEEHPIKMQSKFTSQNGKIKTLYGLEQYLLFGNSNQKPHKYVKLDFETKFEIFRAASEDDSLGPVIGMQLIRFIEKEQITYRLNFQDKQIKEWRTFLTQRINQWHFHHLFRVFKKIGKGSFASVFLAQRIEDNQMFAVKAFSKETAFGENNGKESIISELKIMRQLKNNHLMQLHEVYETPRSLYMILELLKGGSLFELIKEKKVLKFSQIQQILGGIFIGLCEMHSKGIMHRDLKLENILFKEKGNLETAVIADFGLATHVDEPQYLYFRCGTPGYVAPEILQQKTPTCRYNEICDIFSLGLVFFILLTGKPAFPAKSYKTLVKQNRDGFIDFTVKQFQLIPADILNLLINMLSKDPESRIKITECMQHPFVKEKIEMMLDKESEEENGNDLIDEGVDVGFLNSKMQNIYQYDAFDASRNINSQYEDSPGLILLNVSKKQKQIDSFNLLSASSPLFSGRIDTVNSVSSIGNLNSFANGNQLSPTTYTEQYGEQKVRRVSYNLFKKK